MQHTNSETLQKLQWDTFATSFVSFVVVWVLLLLFREFVSKFHANVCDEIFAGMFGRLGHGKETSAAALDDNPHVNVEPNGNGKGCATRNQKEI